MGPYRRTDASPRSYGRVRTALRTRPYDGSDLSVGCCKQNSQFLSPYWGCSDDGHVPQNGARSMETASGKKNSSRSIRPSARKQYLYTGNRRKLCMQ